jgi:flagellar biosynthesis protein FlhG
MKEKSIRTISVTSGKGGVGKTTITVNLANCLANMGKKVLILDGDMSLANVDIFLKSTSQVSMQNFLNGDATLPEVVVKHSRNIHILPGTSGIFEMTHLDAFQKKMLLDGVSQLEEDYDYLIIDTASGISDDVLYLSSAAQDVYVVVQPDPSSMTDSYALMKLLNQKYRKKTFTMISNLVLNEQEGLHLYNRINAVTSKFLNISLHYGGFIPFDLKMRQATHQQELITNLSPTSSSSLCLKQIAGNIEKSSANKEAQGGLQFFWNQVLDIA